jgi:HD-GYP domain-containing protein (c-di-GMP phosphodiesterase class II)
MRVDVRQLVLAIGKATDLVGVDDVWHGRRVGIIAVELAKRLGWDRSAQLLLFDAGVIHDCGVSSTRVHRTLVNEFDWEDSHLHCEKGHALLSDFHPLAHLAPIVLNHHTHWDALAPKGLEPMAALFSNVIYLADRIDVLAAACGGCGPGAASAGLRERVVRHRGTFFASELVDAFVAVSATEAFWLSLATDVVPEYVAEIQNEGNPLIVGHDELRRFALIVADIVDAKSHFTKEHSLGVARLSRYLGGLAGFSGERLGGIEIAGLLHDIGKLQIPDEVLESPNPLSADERTVIRRHSFATWRILHRIGGLGDVARWASEHHESMSGLGYPFHYSGRQIPAESRIVKVADVFQALAQARPYRKPMSPGDILSRLREMQVVDEVDGDLVDLVAGNLARCHEAAVGAA